MTTNNRNIFVFIEAYDGEPTQGARRIIGKARQLAEELGCYVEAICPLEDEWNASRIIHLGADTCHQPRTFVSPSSWDTLLHDAVQALKPEFLLLPASQTCNMLAGIVAGTKNLPLLFNCESLRIDGTSRTFESEFRLFEGSIHVSLVAEKIGPQIATVHFQNLPEPYPDTSRNGRILKLEHDYPSNHSTVPMDEKTVLANADGESEIVILVGPSITKEDDHQLIETFASAINAATISSENMFKEEKYFRLLSKARLLMPIEANYDPAVFLQTPETCRILAINNHEAKIADIADIFVQADFRKVVPSLLKRWKEDHKSIESPTFEDIS